MKNNRGFFLPEQMKETMIKMRKRKVTGIPKKVEEKRMGKPERLLTIFEK